MFRTSDMAMATYLKLEGHTPQVVEWNSGTCYWYFDKTTALELDIAAFQDKKATVEPTEYNRVYSQTKREFYDTKPKADSAPRLAI